MLFQTNNSKKLKGILGMKRNKAPKLKFAIYHSPHHWKQKMVGSVRKVLGSTDWRMLAGLLCKSLLSVMKEQRGQPGTNYFTTFKRDSTGVTESSSSLSSSFTASMAVLWVRHLARHQGSLDADKRQCSCNSLISRQHPPQVWDFRSHRGLHATNVTS